MRSTPLYPCLLHGIPLLGMNSLSSAVSSHRTAVSEVDGGSVWYLVTRGSEGVTVVTATSRRWPSGSKNPPIRRRPLSALAVDRDVLVHGNTLGDEDSFLLYVVGDREPYRAALAAAESVVDFEITEVDDRSFYTFLRQRRPEVDEVGPRSTKRPSEPSSRPA